MPLPTCSICIEPFTQPVSLPCGHVFCKVCIRKAVESESRNLRVLQHLCPSCRTPYSIITIDPALVPSHMRPHVRPSIRPLFLGDSSPSASPAASMPMPMQPQPQPSTSTSTNTSSPPPSIAQAHAEITALRMACSVWQRRAEQHATANLGLLSFARAAKDCALRLRSERDAARTRCTLLKRTLAEAVSLPEYQSGMVAGGSGSGSGVLDADALADISAHLTTDAADYEADTKHAKAHACVGGGLPVYLVQAGIRPAAAYYDNPADVEASHFGPPMKRRKVEDARLTEATPRRESSRSRSRSRSPRRRSPSKTRSTPTPAPALETLATVELFP
ncbi:hypothetical protein C8F01DRAFT_1373170 [Mycena amicta]|nr:hypothetical protein C8F01DRAFT_1373170 [Mycena amicta]